MRNAEITIKMTVLLALVTATVAVAQQPFGSLPKVQSMVQRLLPTEPKFQTQPPIDRPVCPTTGPRVTPVTNPYYFGMNVQLTPSYNGNGLRVVNITPGGPAAVAGLEVGDEIQSVNGGQFHDVRDSFQAVSRMNSLVITTSYRPDFGGPAPAAAAAASSRYVNPNVVPAGQPVASMLVRNVRDGQFVQVTVHPTQRQPVSPYPSPYPQPAPAAPAFR